MHGAYVDGVGLPALPPAEAGLSVLCVQCPFLAGQKKKFADAPITLTLPPVKRRQMTLVRRNQDSLHVLYTSQAAL